jgi:hypothetical protein
MKTNTLLIVGGLIAAVVAIFLFRGRSGSSGPPAISAGGTPKNTGTASAPSVSWGGTLLNLAGYKQDGSNALASVSSAISAGTKGVSTLWESGTKLFGGSTQTNLGGGGSADLGPGVALGEEAFAPVQSVDLSPTEFSDTYTPPESTDTYNDYGEW